MPIYEYECSDCNQVFEIVQKISDRPLSKCPHCGGKVGRLISQTSFTLKGGGWYKDGYSTKKSPTPEKKEGDKKEKKANDKHQITNKPQ